MPINPHISDLFFNSDHNYAAMAGEGRTFSHYDVSRLTQEADVFLKSLSALGVAGLPTIHDLSTDFLRRV